jgi:hypothetical protein
MINTILAFGTLLYHGFLAVATALFRLALTHRRLAAALGVLRRRKILRHAARAHFYRLVGARSSSLAALEILIRDLAVAAQEEGASQATKGILLDCLSLSARAHLEIGQVDQACRLVVRAHQYLKVKCLPAVPFLDVGLAQVLSAGVAAKRLLDTQGQAGILLDPNGARPAPADLVNALKSMDPSLIKRQGASGRPQPVAPPPRLGGSAHIVPLRPEGRPAEPTPPIS